MQMNEFSFRTTNFRKQKNVRRRILTIAPKACKNDKNVIFMHF